MSDPRCICDGSGCCFETCEPCVKDALAERDRRIEELEGALRSVVLTGTSGMATPNDHRVAINEAAAALPPPTTEGETDG